MAITHREARRKLGSRTHRRANRNGKCMWGQRTKGNRSVKRRNPRRDRAAATEVWALVEGRKK